MDSVCSNDEDLECYSECGTISEDLLRDISELDIIAQHADGGDKVMENENDDENQQMASTVEDANETEEEIQATSVSLNEGGLASRRHVFRESVVSFGNKRSFYNLASEEFIRKEEPTTNMMVKQLNLSARLLLHEGMELVLNNNGCLLMVNDDFLAEVRVEEVDSLDETRDFWQARGVLLRMIRIVAVLVDNPVALLEKYRAEILDKVESIMKLSLNDGTRRFICLQLMNLLDKFAHEQRLTYFQLFEEITSKKLFGDELKEYVLIALRLEKTVCKRLLILSQFGYRLEDKSLKLYQRMQKLATETYQQCRNSVWEIATNTLKRKFDRLSPHQLMLVTKEDVKLFSDLKNVLNEEIFSKPLEDLEQLWVQQIESMEANDSINSLETTNKVFFFLCKSLQELILEISELTGIQAVSFLISNSSGWQPINEIIWKEENLLTKSLERQYFFIFHLVHHFTPEASFGKSPFKYEIQRLNNIRKTQSMWDAVSLVVNQTKKQADLKIPEEFYVWYCLLDDVLDNILPVNFDLRDTEIMLQSYLSMIQEAKTDQMESIRVATHNTIRLIVNVIPFMSSDADCSPIDRCIFQKQMALFTCAGYHDMVHVFNNYWDNRKNVITEVVTKMSLPEMNLLKVQLLNIVSAALDKKVENDFLVKFFRAYEEFVIHLGKVPLDWFIKVLPEIDMQTAIALNLVEIVDNKLKDTVDATYRVVDPKNFATLIRSLDIQPLVPKYYVISMLRTLCVQIESLLKKESWISEECLTEEDKLATTCDLLSAMHQSLLLARKQAEYESFERFYEDCVKPFASLIDTSISRQDFATRVYFINESYRNSQKQNDITLDNALLLYKSLNSAIDIHQLKKLYQRYSEHFEILTQSYNVLAAEEIIPKEKPFYTWDTDFKQNEIPLILAGLVAVWSNLVSKDVLCTGKHLSPHCVHILCVLRLLGSDEVASGMDKHLVQILTGQGKSMILALVAAFFALTGHKVDIVCSSKNLVERNRVTFAEFYSVLNISYEISYTTLAEIMEKCVNSEVTKSVLLFDEVDIFYSERFYDNNYIQILTPAIKGLDKIQLFIWKTVSDGVSDTKHITDRVWTLIHCSNFSDLKLFIDRDEEYGLQTNNYGQEMYTNRKLFDEHLSAMIKSAVEVYHNNSRFSELKLNYSGIISSDDTSCGYHKIFNYFHLKKNNFVSEINGHKNFGYLLINCESISYAMLSMNYTLIIDVSENLEYLKRNGRFDFEQIYGIKKMTVMPNLFENFNLTFNMNTDFKMCDSETSWICSIFKKANQVVEQNRAVLIFFETDAKLEAFKSTHGGQFDRLNVLTENGNNMQKCIDEAGIARTITLATRRACRTVSFTSSVVVEQSGGVHVILTFFSTNINREFRVTSRAAGQGNQGSYEFVLCREKK